MKSTVLFALSATIPGLFLMQSTGTSSVVVVDFDRAVAETPAGKDAITKLNAFGNEQRDAIQKKQKEADDLQNRLRTQDRALSEATRGQLVRDLQAAQSAVQTLTDNADKKLHEMEQQLLVPIQQKTQDAVNSYATENSVKIVLDRSTLQNGLVYVHDTADITTEIIRRIAGNIENPQQPKDGVAKFIDKIRNRPWTTSAPVQAAEEASSHR